MLLIFVLLLMCSCAKRYDYVGEYKEGLAKVRLKDKYGFIDENRKEITPIKYEYVYSFSNGLAKVNIGGNVIMFVNSDGERIVNGGKYGLIDKTGKEITPIKYDDISKVYDGLAEVKLNRKSGFVNKKGKEITPIKYDYVNYFSDGVAAVNIGASSSGYQTIWGGEWTLIDSTGTDIIPLKYDVVSGFSDGLAKVRLKDKYGFIDTKGKEVVPLKYDYACDYSYKLAMVRIGEYSGGKYGFIDKIGEEIIPLKYDFGGPFINGLAHVSLNGKYGFIDTTGKEIIPLIYEYADHSKEGYPLVKLEKWGDNFIRINEKGQKVDDQKFSYATHGH